MTHSYSSIGLKKCLGRKYFYFVLELGLYHSEECFISGQQLPYKCTWLKSTVPYHSSLSTATRVLCVLSWLTRAPDWLNPLPQILQLKGFSPVWVLTWSFKMWLVAKRWLQCLHLNGFSAPCLFLMWGTSSYFETKLLLQSLHLTDFSLWISLCLFNAPLSLNACPQTSHE